MTLRDRLAAMAEAADPNGSITVTTRWLRDMLALEGDGNTSAQDVNMDLDVEQVGKLFKRAPSTVRSWLAEGLFPHAYRLRQREWRIPRGDVAALQHGQQKPAQAPPAQPQPAEPADLGAWRKHLPRRSA